MTVWILDTDHVSLWQRQHGPVVEKIGAIGTDNIATTIITVEEQLRGRLDMIRRADSAFARISAYARMQETVVFFQQIQPVYLWSPEAELQHIELKRQRVRIGAQDLRIAAIALAVGSTVVTRNRRDFERIPELPIENWA